jgi:hypothetical protein
MNKEPLWLKQEEEARKIKRYSKVAKMEYNVDEEGDKE